MPTTKNALPARPGQISGLAAGNRNINPYGNLQSQCNAPYFQGYQNPPVRNGIAKLEPQEGFVFWSGVITTAAIGAVVRAALQIPPNFYLLINTAYMVGDTVVAADLPALSLFVAPDSDVPLFVGAPFVAVMARGPAVDIGVEVAVGGSIMSPVAIPFSGLVAPGNFFVVPAAASGSGVAVPVRFTVSGLLLLDRQNPDNREIV